MFRLFLWLALVPTLVFSQSKSQWVDSVYASMSTKERVGQLFMVMSFPNGDSQVRQKTIQQIEKHHIGGVLFSKGTSTQQQLDTRTYQSKSTIPLLIAADAEWGMAMRLRDVSPFPYAMTLGALPHNDLIYALGKRIGERKRNMGVHVSFSPVLDVNTTSNNPIIGIRSFGDQPKQVANKAKAFMEGLQSSGIVAVAKHFPGHGNTTTDSHIALPVINRTRKALDSIDLYPFAQLIKANVKGIMVGHLDVPALSDTTNIPISTSKKVVTDLLQRNLGFKGLIFTDALDMDGILSHVESPALASFLAGADVLLVPKHLENEITLMTSHVQQKNISEERLAHSVKKILGVKYNLGLNKSHLNRIQKNALQTTYVDRYLQQQIAAKSLVLLHQKKGLFPLTDRHPITYVSLGKATNSTFLNALRENVNVTQVSKFNLKKIHLNARTLVVGVYGNTSTPWTNPFQTDADMALLAKLSALPNVHVVLFANPYVLSQFPALESFASVILAHENREVFSKAAAHLLSGKIKPLGIMPLSIHP